MRRATGSSSGEWQLGLLIHTLSIRVSRDGEGSERWGVCEQWKHGSKQSCLMQPFQSASMFCFLSGDLSVYFLIPCYSKRSLCPCCRLVSVCVSMCLSLCLCVYVYLFSKQFSFFVKIYLFYVYEFTVNVYRHTRRGHQIPLQMAVSHHVVAGKLNSGPL